MQVIASWSGGKDSALACYKALVQGYEVSHLVNFISREFMRVSFHGTRAPLISKQAKAIGIPLVQYKVQPDLTLYEHTFKRAVSAMKRKGIEGMVFGDIYIQEQRDWVDRVCDDLEITPVLPLWGMTSEEVLNEFINVGFEAVVVAANASVFNEDWLGRNIDRKLVADLNSIKQRKEVDVCGERGEYHTLTVDGPIFQQRLETVYGIKVHRDGYWLIDIPRSKLITKM